jgi:hypothetical protein
VNSCVSCTRLSGLKSALLCELHKVVAGYFTDIFPSSESLEFPVVRFLVTCARETLINKWNIPWVILDKWMVHPLGYP